MAAAPSALIISFYIGAPECVSMRAPMRRAPAAASGWDWKAGTGAAPHVRSTSQRADG